MNTGHQVPTTLPAGRLEETIDEYKPAFNTAAAIAEANRCLYCHDAPCIQACPTAINIPEFIRKIATGNLRGATKTILADNILGYSCARVCPVDVLCQGSCVYHNLQQLPIQIGRLQRYATDHALAKGMKFFHKGASTGKQVAIIGAGPAGLACAHQLTRSGHEVVVFDASTYPGGLNISGIAAYKMKSRAVLEEVHQIMEIGFEVRCNTTIGQDISIEELNNHYDAILFATGLGSDTTPELEGVDLDGVTGAVALIDRIKLDPELSLGKVMNAVVVGGGNTAIDATRELLQVGISNVTMLYRRSAKEMSGYAHEWKAARDEGAHVLWQSIPKAMTGEDGRVTHLLCTRVFPDAKTGNLEPVPDSEFSLPAELVVFAVGQHRFSDFFTKQGIDFKAGKVLVDPVTGQTSQPRYFAAGDCVNGAKEVVNAVAEGKRAAIGIDQMLRAQ